MDSRAVNYYCKTFITLDAVSANMFYNIDHSDVRYLMRQCLAEIDTLRKWKHWGNKKRPLQSGKSPFLIFILCQRALWGQLVTKPFAFLLVHLPSQRRLYIGGSDTVQVWLVYSFTSTDSTASLHTNHHKFYFLVKSNHVKLETSITVILRPQESVLWPSWQ